jgi:hypothetical protein
MRLFIIPVLECAWGDKMNTLFFVGCSCQDYNRVITDWQYGHIDWPKNKHMSAAPFGIGRRRFPSFGSHRCSQSHWADFGHPVDFIKSGEQATPAKINEIRDVLNRNESQLKCWLDQRIAGMKRNIMDLFQNRLSKIQLVPK